MPSPEQGRKKDEAATKHARSLALARMAAAYLDLVKRSLEQEPSYFDDLEFEDQR